MVFLQDYGDGDKPLGTNSRVVFYLDEEKTQRVTVHMADSSVNIDLLTPGLSRLQIEPVCGTQIQVRADKTR